VVLPALALAFIAGGVMARVMVNAAWGDRVWMAGLVIAGLPVIWQTLRGVMRGRFAADLVAMLAIVGAIPLGEPLAGLVVVLMQTGGEALERYAEGRASDAVRELEKQAPDIAHRIHGERIDDISADAVAIGDELLVRPGELVPCDGVVVKGRSHVDAARLTGEPVPISAAPGTRLLSGSHNIEGPLTLRATAPARESQYARIVELVRTAQASKTPLQRVADRYAVWFTPFTLVVCAAAYFASHDAVRVLAVLVVATPCPLILATPVAVVGGINRAARSGILFRNGAALEQLAQVDVAVFDKTGTLTIGRPLVSRVLAADDFDAETVLRFAGAVEHGSGHLLARTLVEEAEARGIAPGEAHDVVESAGQGVSGRVDDHMVLVGGWSYVAERAPQSTAGFAPLLQASGDTGLRAYVSIDGHAAGIVEYADRLRADLPAFMTALRRLGVRRTILLSGDDQLNARRVAESIGIEEAHGNLLPAQKTAVVQGLVKGGSRVLMVGDGTNDAPALSAATVGIALTATGGGITAEAADAVMLADDPTRIAAAVEVSRHTLRVARESIGVGLGLSGVAMVIAGFGYIPPTVGALLQEAIDVAVILNALRAARTPDAPSPAQ